MLGLILMTMLWQNDPGLAYQRLAVPAPAYLTSAADAMRWHRVRTCKMLYRGAHRQYFLHEGHTQSNFPWEEIDGAGRRQRYITFNLCKLISHTTADLMFGAPPKLSASSPAQTARLEDLARRSLLHPRLHEVTVQMSWAGGGFLEATLWRGEVYIEVAPADEMFPQGRPTPDGQYGSYVRYATDTIPGKSENDKVTTLLLKTTYLPGKITRELRELDEKGGVAGDPLPLEKWPAFNNAPPPLPEVATGLRQNTIIYVANKVGDSVGLSDYDGLVELQDTVNAKYAQFAHVIAQHADPKMWFGTDGGADAAGNVKATHNAFYGPEKPEYIGWDPHLDAADRDRVASIMAFCTAAEMSPVLLGIRQGASPDAARKLRLEATKDLAKTARKALTVGPAIGLALEVAQQLDQTTPKLRSYPIDKPGVQMRDGLPVDEVDQANAIASYRSAGVMSVRSGVEQRVGGDEAAVEAEMKLLEEERADATPRVFLAGGRTGREPGDTVAAAEGSADGAAPAAGSAAGSAAEEQVAA